jgi:lysophospholipase L1-like esterase
MIGIFDRKERSEMSGPRAIRLILVAVIALCTIGLAGDIAKGARAKPKERADRPAIRTGTFAGVPDAWAKAHRRYTERARRADAEVVFLGDSITYGWGEEGREDLGKPSWLAEFAPLKAANFGFSGDQTQHLLYRIENGELDGHPRVAVVLIGTNNLSEGQSPEATASGVAAVVDAIHEVSPTTRVLLVGLLPRLPGADGPYSAGVKQVNAIVRGWSREAEVEFLDAGAAFLKPDGQLDWDLSLDGLHPSAKGYRALADVLRGPVRRLLGVG